MMRLCFMDRFFACPAIRFLPFGRQSPALVLFAAVPFLQSRTTMRVMLNWLRGLKRSFSVHQPEAELLAENSEAGTRKYRFLQNVQIQTRRAQPLDPQYAE